MSKKTRGPGDYEVGYGRPPEEFQYKPGESGNSAGRRKKAKPAAELPAGLSALDVAILRAGERPAEMAFGGEGRSETGIEAVVNAILGAAIDGDMRAAKMFKDSYAAADAERRRLTPKDQGGGISVQLIGEWMDFLRYKKKASAEGGSEAGGIAAEQDETACGRAATVVSDEIEAWLSPPAAFSPLGGLPDELLYAEPQEPQLPIPERATAREAAGRASASSAMSGDASAPSQPLVATSAPRTRRGEPLIQNTQPFSAGGWGTAPKPPGG